MFIEELGAGAPVVFLHSSGLSGRQFKRLATTLADRGFRTILPDLGGHGKSPAIAFPAPFSITDDVDAIAALLRAQSTSVHLVGHSYGALAALHVALRMPDKIRSMALFEPVAFGMLDPNVHREACAELERAAGTWGTSDADHDAWLQKFVDYWGGQGAWQSQKEEARAEFRRVGWAVHEGVRSLLEDRTPLSSYAAIEAPMTLMTAERSPLAARTVVELLGASRKNAHVVRFANAGHMAPLTHAAEVNAVIVDAITSAA